MKVKVGKYGELLLTEVFPGMYHVQGTRHDVSMTFLRSQEYYESDNPDFKGRAFHLEDYMTWYASERGQGVFNYPQTFDGYNVSEKVITGALGSAQSINEWTIYDQAMRDVCSVIEDEFGIKDYYLIGSAAPCVMDSDVVRHEIAHGFYYLDENYKVEVDHLLNEFGKEAAPIHQHLEMLGYSKDVWEDETQAYLIGGFALKGEVPEKIRAVFEETLNERLTSKEKEECTTSTL